jgi:glycogen operon protein
LILLNAHHELIPLTLPSPPGSNEWERLFDTAETADKTATAPGGQAYKLRDRSMAVFRARRLRRVLWITRRKLRPK